jgi:rare lipoprotein A (peptidoglycan hydrolase)
VTDRGPYIDGRALDVSRAIADELGMVEDGLATVRMWAVRIPTGTMVAGRLSEGD